MKLKHVFISLVLLTVFAMCFSMTATQEVRAGAGTAGTISFGFSEFSPGNSYTFILNDLDESSDYCLTFSLEASDNYTFVTGADETSLSYRCTLNAPSSGSEVLVQLRATNETGTVLDQLRLQAVDITEVINAGGITDIITALIPILFLLGVFVSILVVIKKKL